MADFPLASIEAFEQLLGSQLAGGESARAASLLDHASALVRVEADEDWIDDITGLPLPVPAIVQTVTLEVARRAFRNPDGVAQTSVGDVSVSYGRGGTFLGSLALTPFERKQVRKAAGRPGYGSISLQVTEGESEWITI